MILNKVHVNLHHIEDNLDSSHKQENKFYKARLVVLSDNDYNNAKMEQFRLSLIKRMQSDTVVRGLVITVFEARPNLVALHIKYT